MLILTSFGNSTDFFADAFRNDTGTQPGFNPEWISASTDRIVIRNPATGAVSEFIGSDLPLTPVDGARTGTLNRIEIENANGAPIAAFSGFSWSFAAFVTALEASIGNNNEAPLNDLFSLQDIRVEGFDSNSGLSINLNGIGSNATLFGSRFEDRLSGGDGNDYINPGASNLGETILGSPGNDRIDFSRHSPDAHADIFYGNLQGPVRINVDGNANTATVEKGPFGTDAIIETNKVMRAGGLTVLGTDFADTFNVNSGLSGWSSYSGGGGNDTFNVTLAPDSIVRLDWHTQDTNGIRMNLQTGVVSDGQGGTDRINVVQDGGRLEIRATDRTDWMAGSTAGERFEGGGGGDLIAADGAIAAYFGANIANQVYRLYQATLDRAPDIGGHANWAGRIASGERTLAEVADGFVRSPQFKATYSDDISDSAFVTLLYNNVLDRAPDAQGLARWTGELAGGATRAEVVLGFSQSPQFVTDTAPAANAFAANSAAASWSDEVYRLYQATLDRAPDVTGQNRWTGELASGASSLLDVADGFVRSPQFQATYQNLDNTAFVTLLYNNVLDRAPDDQGLARWVGELQGGASRADVVLGFSQSPQFAANTAPDVKTWMRDLGTHDRIEPGSGTNGVAGGQYADVFVFNANDDGRTTVADLEAWDFIELNGFGYGTAAAARAEMAQSGGDVVFADQGVEVIFRGTALVDISDDMILV